MDILDEKGVSKLSANFFLLSMCSLEFHDRILYLIYFLLFTFNVIN